MINRLYIILYFLLVFVLFACAGELPQPVLLIENSDKLTSLKKEAKAKISLAKSRLCENYQKRDVSPIGYSYAIAIINMRSQSRTSSSALNDPFEMHSDILCALEDKDEKALFINDILEEYSDHGIRYPAEEKKLESLIEALKVGFIAGHPLVGVLLSTSGHQIMAAFRDNGDFYIIDSMGGIVLNAEVLAGKLNQADISDKNGFLIKFSGKNISTSLQKGGNDCIRLAGLYLRQIILENDLDAYEKVNGAFVDGLLKKFEDIDKIKQARKLSRVKENIDRDRDEFMTSWDHRNYGITTHDDGYKGIEIGSLRPMSHGGKEHETSHLINLWKVKKGLDACFYLSRIFVTQDCDAGINFCVEGKKSKNIFFHNYIDINQISVMADNNTENHVSRLSNLNEKLSSILDKYSNYADHAIIYHHASRFFYLVKLNN